MMNATQLKHTAQVLADMLTFKQPADAVLSDYFRQHRKLGRQDRHEIAETAFAALRHYQKIAAVMRSRKKRHWRRWCWGAARTCRSWHIWRTRKPWNL